MLSSEQRRDANHFEQHLHDARRRALGGGLRWFCAINLLAILYLLARFHVYRDARLVAADALPWAYEWQIGLMAVTGLLMPLGWRWLSYQRQAVWLPWLWGGALLWGSAWALTSYAIAMIELRGGFSLAFNMVSLLLLTALVAFYCEWRLFYCLIGPPLLFLLLEGHWVLVPFMAVHWLAVGCLLIVLETGRRMLNGWFELAVTREHDNLALARRLDAMANSDPLTGVANRRYFATVSERFLQEVQSRQEALALILLDVDFFKKFNDNYGHQQGDECLIAVADCLRLSVREPVDVVARYGGEEFVILLPGADGTAAEAVARRIAAELACCAIPHAASVVAERVTASQGIALWRQGESIDELLARADQALYRAKEEGRNGYRLAP